MNTSERFMRKISPLYVEHAITNLQDELEEQLRNLHIDMINQFHQQQQEIENRPLPFPKHLKQ